MASRNLAVEKARAKASPVGATTRKVLKARVVQKEPAQET